MGELAIVNTAIIIFAINQRFEYDRARAIIDSFLHLANRDIFSVLDSNDVRFKEVYQKRIDEYFRAHNQNQPVLGITSIFMHSLGVDPLKSLRGQLVLAVRFGATRKAALDILSKATSAKIKFISDFEKEIAHWPVNQAQTALQIIRDTLSGDVRNIEEVICDLTVDQINKIANFLRRLEGDGELHFDNGLMEVNEDEKVLDDTDARAKRYHQQIDEQIEVSYRFLSDRFGQNYTEAKRSRYTLRTLSVFVVHIATLIAVKRYYPYIHRGTLNGFTRTLSFRTPNSMPDVEPPEDMLVSYCSEEESFMHWQTRTFEQQGLKPLVGRLLYELGGEPEDYYVLLEHLENVSQYASRTYLLYLARG